MKSYQMLRMLFIAMVLLPVQVNLSLFAESKDTTQFIEIMNRDNSLSIPPSSYVPQNAGIKPDASVTIELSEGDTYIGAGVLFKGFVINGSIPGPNIIVNEGDIVEFTVVNKGQIPHGASIHSASTQTSKYLGKINAGETKSMLFKASRPGVYMYHCAPGGHGIPLHILFGQYGMMTVKPKKQYKLEQMLNKKPDVELYILQHEMYSSGKDAIDGNPIYTMWNGKLFKYIEQPIKAKPGDYVRINYLNVGPNKVSTFHIVGIMWDFVYWQGNPDLPQPGGQTVTSGPSDSWVIEFRMPPDEGTYTMLDHAVSAADRGAIGLLICDRNAVTPVTITADGPQYEEKELKDIKSKIIRTIAPFEPGTPDVDPVVEYGPEVKEVMIKIIGNSFYPKSIKVHQGTTVTWQNEEVFTYMEGEFSGIHTASTYDAPEPFSSPLLGHAETFKVKLDKAGTYKYLCAPHPYMKGVVTVVNGNETAGTKGNMWIFVLVILTILLIIYALYKINSIKKNIVVSPSST
ncbi:MAG TPA: plastocyanin/azurin family copper-binding protein [Ignavibacteria bacterium]|nr:plastocyanin/azurin family copper-binding protein [Ignavibacteria bacterium]